MDLDTGKKRGTLAPHHAPLSGLAFSPNGETLVSIWCNGLIRFWNTTTLQQSAQIRVGNGRCPPLAFSRDLKALALATPEDKVQVIDVPTAKRRATLEGHQGKIKQLLFSPSGRTLASVGHENVVYLWDVARGKLEKRFSQQADWLCFSPDGTLLALAHSEGIQFSSISKGKAPAPISCEATLGVFSNDRRTLFFVTGSTIRQWDLTTDREVNPPNGHLGALLRLWFFPDSRAIASWGRDDTLRLWDATTGKERASAILGKDVWAVDVAPTYVFAVSGHDDGTIRLWEFATIQKAASILGKRGPVRSIRVSPNARYVASGEQDGSVFVWNLRLSHPPSKLVAQPSAVRAVEFSADSHRLALAQTGQVSLVSVEGGQVLRIFGRHLFAESLWFMSDDKILITRGHRVQEKPVVLWDVNGGTKLWEIDDPKDKVIRAFALSPDEKVLALGYNDGSITLFETATALPFLTVAGHDGPVMALVFSFNGRLLCSGGAEGTCFVWDVYQNLLDRNQTRRTSKELDNLWERLADHNPAIAQRAIANLLSMPTAAACLLEQRFSPCAEKDTRIIKQLILNLDSDSFRVRLKALEKLKSLGREAQPSIIKHLRGKTSEEVRVTLTKLGPSGRVVRSPDTLRKLRAIQALEQIESDRAKRFLRRIAAGEPDAFVTQEAQRAYRRLQRKGPIGAR
jgi:WD40 repeat protein